MALNIVSPGPLTTVQDFGRHGHQAEGYPECGACDKYALALANLLCGNGDCPHVAGLEYTLCGPTVRAADYTLVALTGGTVLPTVNGKRVPMFEPLLLAPGDTLEIGMLSSGLRGYLAVFGGFDIRPVLGSRSTDLKCHIGGLSGRALKAGDVLPVLRAFELPQERYKPLKKRLEAVVLEDWALATLSPHGFIGAQKFPLLRVVLGPQDDAFTEKGLFDFKSALYTVTQDSNRMAAKLSGAPIEAKAGVDILSDGIVEGSVSGFRKRPADCDACRPPEHRRLCQNRDGDPLRHPGAGAGSPRPARRLPRRERGRGRGGLPEGKRKMDVSQGGDRP